MTALREFNEIFAFKKLHLPRRGACVCNF